MTVYQFQDYIINWADIIWTERREEMNGVTDRFNEDRPDLSDANIEPAGPPREGGEFFQDPVLENLKDQVY